MRKRRFLGILLMLALLLTLLPGMGLTAYAETEKSETIATTDEQVVEGTHFIISANDNYVDEDGMAARADYGGITVTRKNNEYITKVVITCEYDRENVSDATTSVSTGTKTITNGGGTITVTEVNANTFKFTCTEDAPQFRQFVVYYLPAYSVTVTPGSNMTKTAESGDAEQTGLTGAMTNVVYTANDGYYFPTDYSVAAVNGISVTRNSNTQITVSGTPTADAAITLTAPTAKTTPAVSDFTYTAPNYGFPTYDGTAKTATVEPKEGITGMGNVTVKYFSGFEWDEAQENEVQSPINAGEYYVGITVAEGDNYSAVSDVLHDSSWKFSIRKADPTAHDFTYSAPSDLTYSGTPKTATVVPNVGITGMGNVTVKYYSDPTYSTEVTPTNVGTYYVGITLSEGNNYNRVSTARHDQNWQFTISKQDAPTSLNDNQKPAAKTGLTYTGSDQALVTAPSEIPDGYIEVQYALGTATEATQPYTTSIPTATDAGTYYVWYRVVGDANHNDTQPDCVPVELAPAEPTITGYALELTGTLGLRYYMELPTDAAFDYSESTMTFSMNQREDQVFTLDEITQGEYFTCDVYAYQMADKINATFTYKKNGETQTLTDTYSVKQYLDELKDGEYSGEALALVNATRAYGHFVQPYLARLHGWTVGEKYAAMDYAGTVDVDAAASGAESYPHSVSMTEAVKSAQYRLMLNADTSMFVEVRLKEAPAGTVTMTVGGKTITPTVSGTAYRVEIPNIPAFFLGRKLAVALKDGDTTVFDFTASPMSYVRTVLTQGGAPEDEQQALAALYHYYVAADAYAKSMSN